MLEAKWNKNCGSVSIVKILMLMICIHNKKEKAKKQKAYFKKSTRKKTLGIRNSKSMQVAKFR